MTLPSNHRWLLVGKLVMRNRKNAPSYAPKFYLSDLISAIEYRVANNDIYRPYGNASKLIWCQRCAQDNDYYRLLLDIGDKNVSGVSYLDFLTLRTRDIPKEEEEGSHYSSHILIRKTPDQYGRYLILIEKVPGVSLASVKAHLTWACNIPICEKEYVDVEGNSRNFRPFFEIDGHQSKTIREALRTGVLQDIEFISNEENHGEGLDEEPIIEEQVHEARWQIKKRVTEDQARSVFRKITEFFPTFRSGAQDKHVFVRIKAPNGQIKRTEVQHYGDDILEQAFIQNEIVEGFDHPLTQRHEMFRDDMIRKMVEVASNVGD